MKGKNRTFYYILLVIVLMALSMTVLLFCQHELVQQGRERFSDNLLASARERSVTMEAAVESRFSLLESLADLLYLEDDLSQEQIASMLRAAGASSSFASIDVVDDDSASLQDSGLSAQQQAAVLRALSGRRAVEHIPSDQAGGEAHFFFAVPAREAGQVHAVLTGAVSDAAFEPLISYGAYGEESYFFLCDGQGNLVLGSDNQYFHADKRNLFALLKEAPFEQGADDIAQIQDLMARRESGTLAYSIAQSGRYAALFPLSINDWYLFHAVTQDRMDSELARMISPVFGVLLLFLIVVCVLLFLCLLWEGRRSSQRDQKTRQTLAQLTKTAQADPLTGLLNRKAAAEQIDDFLNGEGLSGRHAFFLIDLDDFKSLNDTFGHGEGDALLISVAEKMRETFRPTDVLARLGGDEFMALIKNVPNDAMLADKAQDLITRLESTHTGGDITLCITCSVGIASCEPKARKAFETLYREADEALYGAKQAGKARWRFFSPPDETLATHQGAFKGARSSVHLHALMNYLNGGLILFEVGPSIRALYVSPSFTPLSGLSTEALTSCADCIPLLCDAHDTARLTAALRSAGQGAKPIDVIYRSAVRSNQVKWHHLHAMPVPVAAGAAPTLFGIITDVTQLKTTEQELYAKRRQLESVLSVSQLSTIEIDLPRRRLRVSQGVAEKYGLSLDWIEDVPQSILARGLLHPDSAEEFLAFFDSLYAGASQGSVLVRLRRPDNSYAMERISCTVICDELSGEARAIGVSEGLETLSNDVLRFEQQKQLFLHVADFLFSSLRVDLAHDRVEVLKSDPALEHCGVVASYSQALQNRASLIDDPAERSALLETFDVASLKKACRSGVGHLSLEHRLRNIDGARHWQSTTAVLLTNPSDGAPHAFVFAQDIDLRKQIEAALQEPAKVDVYHGFYARQTFKQMAELTLARDDLTDNAHRALTLFGITHFFELQSRFGIQSMAGLLTRVARKFDLLLSSDHLISYLGGGVFALFSLHAATKEQLLQTAEAMLDLLCSPSLLLDREEEALHYRCGVALAEDTALSFDLLLENAGFAMRDPRAKEDYPFFYEPPADDARKEPTSPVLTERQLAQAAIRMLDTSDAGQKDAFQIALHSLFSPGSLKELITGALGALGRYYEADRAHILEIDSSSLLLSNTYEWCAPGVMAALPFLQRLPLAESPSFLAAWRQRHELHLSEDHPEHPFQGEETSILGVQNVSSVWAIPYYLPNGRSGFLGLDNARAHLDRPDLLYAMGHLLPCRVSADGKLVTDQTDALTGLSSHDHYLRVCQETSGGKPLVQVGAFVVQINDWDAVARSFGETFCQRLLCFAAEILYAHFPAAMLFRYDAHTLLALTRDIAPELFEECSALTRQTLERHQPGDFACAHLWSAQTDDLDKLVQNARLKLNHSGSGFALPSALHQPSVELRAFLEEGRFELWLEPKIDLRTGALTGAEGLSRLRHPTCGLLAPRRFIPELEQAGTIFYLDCHMFEQVCRLQAQWRAQGLPALPLSVNFSTSTLCVPDLLDTLCAIADRHGADRSLIEIEVSETAGALEQQMLIRLGGALHKAGFALCLDNFGARAVNFPLLTLLDFSTVKLDKSLTEKAPADSRVRELLRSLLSLCKNLGVSSVVEGVETAQQANLLLELGAGESQGFLYSRALRAEDFAARYLPGASS